MSAAFLFSAVEAAAPDLAVEELLQKAGARPAWLNQVHWLGQPAPAPLPNCPFFAWPEHALLAFFCLQSAMLSLETGAADLILLGQSAGMGAAALLLGSPAAVGRWNLPPAAHLHALPAPAAAPGAFVQAALQAAATLLPEEAHLALAAVRGVAESALPALSEGLTCLPDAVPALAQAGRLAGELTRTGQDFGLLAEFSTHGGLAFLVERV